MRARCYTAVAVTSPPVTLTAVELDIAVANRVLVQGLALDLRAGELLAVLGQNGAGKTLTLLSLAGLRAPAAGTVSLFGTPLSKLRRRDVARNVGFLPQDSDDVFPATVFETALIGRHPHIDPLRLESLRDREIALTALDQVGLKALTERDVGTLSGGERRRLAIAQTLSQAPRVFLLDEPLNHLDPQYQLDVLDLFSARAADGASIIASLHDVNLARRYADRCLLLFGDGRWLLDETQAALTEENLSELFEVQMESLPWKGSHLFVAVSSREH